MFLKLLLKIYNLWAKKGFFKFGKNAFISPFLNTANKQYISIGNNVKIGSFSWIGVVTEFAGIKCNSERKVRLSIGNNTTIGNNAVITANNNVSIGKNCILSSFVYISDHIHQYQDVSKNLNQQPLSKNGYVEIKDNVFIGIKSSIMRNITIGEHCIIGANSVVTKDLPPYSVAVGNPAKIIKKYNFNKKIWEIVENNKK